MAVGIAAERIGVVEPDQRADRGQRQTVGGPEGAFVVQASRLASGAEQALADHRRIGVVRVRDHRRRTDGMGAVVAMAELLAGTSAIVLLLERLTDEIGAKAAARLETARAEARRGGKEGVRK